MAKPFWQYDSDNTLLAFRKLHASTKQNNLGQSNYHSGNKKSNVMLTIHAEKEQAQLHCSTQSLCFPETYQICRDGRKCIHFSC